MSSPADDPIREWVNQLVRHEKTTPTGLARKTGVNQATLSRFLSGKTVQLSARNLQSLRNHSSIAVPVEVSRLIDAAPLSASQNRLMRDNDNPSELQVWGAHPIRGSSEFRLNPVPLTHFKRPRGTYESRHLMSFYAPDESMSPRWRMGEPVVVDIARPATAGGFALLRLTSEEDENADEVMLFRKYNGRSRGMVLVSSLEEPGEDIVIPMVRVLRVSHVLDWSDLIK